jgi:hypothetical protein
MHATFAQQVGALINPAYQELVFIGVGVLFIVVGLPLAMSIIPPNRWGGVRLRRTLSDERIWYLANSYCGKAYILHGSITIVLAVALRLTAMSPATYGSIGLLVIFGGLALTSAAILIYTMRVS